MKTLKLKKPSIYRALILQKTKNTNFSKITPFLKDANLDIRKYDNMVKNGIFDKTTKTILPFFISSQSLSDYLSLQLISPLKLKDDCFKMNF
tara:strand:+ start:645 stop:920 length:276 start_codon:yes stop_codon:yes gene_type:complete